LKYSDQLHQPEWKAKRLLILQRDGYRCASCSSNKNLQVHHKKYIKGKAAWDIPDSYLTTLCLSCHNLEHKERHINEFIEKPKKKKKAPKKKKDRMEGLSVEQKRIQARYDSIFGRT
jgi:5-methylcytosine-specific restriction endonuclease McrA